MKQRQSILIADDDPSIVTALSLLLKPAGYEVVAVNTPNDALLILKRRNFSAILLDLNYQKDTTSGQEGFELIEQIHSIEPNVPLIVMTGYSSIDIAVKTMQLGAVDFVQKPWRNERLLTILQKQIAIQAMKHQGEKLAEENALLRNEKVLPLAGIIAESEAMQSLLATLSRIAKSDMNVLLLGENGTGKSLLANYLHQQSQRSVGTFLSVNMGAITESLFESEMFGHVKGAFTDAKEQRIGRFELAEQGTLFLDEIANIPLSQQAKLLRVLEEKCFEKVGATKTQQVDVRLVSATNASLDELIEQGHFRQDLLYRLNTVEISIPPLRKRVADILPLANYFLQCHAEKYRLPEKPFSHDAQQALELYNWPGNVRELNHLIERAMFLSQEAQITVQDLGLPHAEPQHAMPIECDIETATLDEVEKYIINKRLRKLGNQCMEVAKSLGLSRSAYYRRLDKYKL